MRNRVSLFVVTAVAIGVLLTGCGSGPGTDKMTEQSSIDGTWIFHGFSAVIAVPDITVTVGDGMNPLSDDPLFGAVTQVAAKGTLTMSGTSYTLTLAEGDDAISVMTTSDASPATEALAIAAIEGAIEGAQEGVVDIEVSDDMMTVKGSFLSKLAEALGMTVPEEGLVACRDAPCSMMAS